MLLIIFGTNHLYRLLIRNLFSFRCCFKGPEEEYPRKLDCMEFVCRSPSDYYKAGNSPYLTARYSMNPDHGFIWTTVGPIVFNKNDNEDEINALIDCR